MLKDYFSQVSGKYSGRYGLEIETESPSYKDLACLNAESQVDPETDKLFFVLPTLPAFVGHEDGSLRNYGMEFVFKKPLDLFDAEDALDEFARQTSTIPFIKDPAAGSVHVHVNVSHMSLRQLANFMFLWILLENVMIEFCGDFRQTNLFALPTRCAESTSKNIVQMFTSLNEGNSRAISFSMESVKYAALNLSAINRFGSLEIRCLEGTTDVERIKTWLRMIDRIVEYALAAEDPVALLEEVKASRTSIPMAILGEFIHEFSGPIAIKDLVSRNLWYAASIADAVPSWSDLEGMYPLKRKPTKKPSELFSSYEELLSMYQTAMPNTPASIPIINGVNVSTVFVDDLGNHFDANEVQW